MLVQTGGGVSILFGHYLIGFADMIASFYYTKAIVGELKLRTGPTTKSERRARFLIDAVGFFIIYAAFLGWLLPIRTSVAWCLFGLATFATPIVIYACWISIYRDSPVDELNESNQSPQPTRASDPGGDINVRQAP